MMGGDISLNPGPMEPKRKVNKNSRKPICNTIHSIITKCRYRNSRLTRNPNNLIVVQRSKIPSQDNGLFQVCSLNARSLRNKSAAFVDLVSDLKADLFTIFESWLTELDSAVITDLTPPGYSKLIHCPRADRRGGGTALLIWECLNVIKTFSAERSSFEVSEWLINSGSRRLRVIVVYRLGYSVDHPITSSVFFNEFSEYLESILMSNEPLLITGDFNFHMDVLSNPDSIRFNDLLDSVGLIQHVKLPTHIHGHTLDLFITRQPDDIMDSEPLPEIFISDHAVMICKLRLTRPKIKSKHTEYRKL